MKIIKNIFQALTVLSIGLGLRKTLRLIKDYPAMILTPMITYWSMAPVSKQNSCELPFDVLTNNESKHIGVSFWHTWANFVISTLGGISYWLLCLPLFENT